MTTWLHWGLVVADAERQAARDAATADTLREIVGLLGRGGEVPPAKTGRKTTGRPAPARKSSATQ